MTVALLTLNLMSVVAISITVYYGIKIPEGGGAFGRHFMIALAAAMLSVFTHTMTYFYFAGMSGNIKRAVEEHGKGKERLAESRRIKAKVMPWAFGGMGLLMATFVLGGAAHTRALPSWIHGGLGYLALIYSGLALLVEANYLLQQNALANAFHRELAGAKNDAA